MVGVVLCLTVDAWCGCLMCDPCGLRCDLLVCVRWSVMVGGDSVHRAGLPAVQNNTFKTLFSVLCSRVLAAFLVLTWLWINPWHGVVNAYFPSLFSLTNLLSTQFHRPAKLIYFFYTLPCVSQSAVVKVNIVCLIMEKARLNYRKSNAVNIFMHHLNFSNEFC